MQSTSIEREHLLHRGGRIRAGEGELQKNAGLPGQKRTRRDPARFLPARKTSTVMPPPTRDARTTITPDFEASMSASSVLPCTEPFPVPA